MAHHDPGSRLTFEYLRQHPEDAARVLERLPVETVVELIQRLPARLAAPVLSAMLPYTAGRCLARLPAAVAGAVIAQSSAARASAMLRLLNEERVDDLFRHVSSGHAARIRRLRSYPDDTVGAWIDSEVVALSGQYSAGEARDHLRDHPDLHLHQLYVVDERRRLVGVVTLGALLHAEAERNLGALSHPAPHTVSTRMSLREARRHRGWARLCALPVVEPGGEFVGELRLGALQQADRRDSAADQELLLPAFEALAGGFSATVAEAVRLLFAGWKSQPRSHDHGP